MSRADSHEGWSWTLPARPCTCVDCGALWYRVEASKRTADFCRWLAAQAIHTGEATSITDPDGSTMTFRPLFAVGPGFAWDTDGDTYGYEPPIPVVDATSFADYLEIGAGEN